MHRWTVYNNRPAMRVNLRRVTKSSHGAVCPVTIPT